LSENHENSPKRIPGWVLILVAVGMVIVIGMGFYLAITTPQGTDLDGNEIPEVEFDEEVAEEEEPETPEADEEMTAIEAAAKIVAVIADEDEAALEAAASDTGVRFSPSAFVDITSDLVVAPSGFQGFFDDPAIFTWGTRAGSGEPISSTNREYWDEFVYRENFLGARLVSENTRQASSSTIDNSATVYPSATIIEYYFPPSEEGGLDWAGLRLAIEQDGSDWVLVGVMMDLWSP